METDYRKHRSREGSDWSGFVTGTDSDRFNPRSREGSDPHGVRWRLNDAGFNPRSREGSDYVCEYFVFTHMVSIRAPVKGATLPPP